MPLKDVLCFGTTHIDTDMALRRVFGNSVLNETLFFFLFLNHNVPFPLQNAVPQSEMSPGKEML